MSTIKDSFPLRILLRPAETFRGIGRESWAWPAGLFALSMASSALLLSVLPPEFVADAFEGISLPRDRGFAFYLLVSLPGGLAFTAVICALLLAFASFLGSGRLSLRLPAAAAATAAFGMLSVAARSPAMPRAAGLAALLAAAALALFSGWRRRDLYPAVLKTMLALSVIALAGDIAGGAAALAGSIGAYSAAQHIFAVFSLIWLAKGVAAISGCGMPRAAAASVLALLAGAASLFLLFNIGLLPAELFQVLLLV